MPGTQYTLNRSGILLPDYWTLDPEVLQMLGNRTLEAEVGQAEARSSIKASLTQQVPGQRGMHRETLSPNKTNKSNMHTKTTTTANTDARNKEQ